MCSLVCVQYSNNIHGTVLQYFLKIWDIRLKYAWKSWICVFWHHVPYNIYYIIFTKTAVQLFNCCHDENISSQCSSNSEASALELLENVKKFFLGTAGTTIHISGWNDTILCDPSREDQSVVYTYPLYDAINIMATYSNNATIILKNILNFRLKKYRHFLEMV